MIDSYQYASANPSIATTDGVLIAAPTAPYAIVIYGLIVSSDTAQVVTLESADGGGDRLRFRQYVAANGGSVFRPEYGAAMFVLPPATALEYTTSVAGNAFIGVWYELQRV